MPDGFPEIDGHSLSFFIKKLNSDAGGFRHVERFPLV
jgi:hypothetical protein